MAGITVKPDAPYKDFAERLYKLRNDAGMTRAQLAEKCDIAARTIINYENGTRIPYADTAAKMARVFKMSIEEFLGIENPAQEQKKAQAVDEISQMYGSREAAQVASLLNATNDLLAGGTLTADQQQDFILEMQKMFIIATERAREKYTPKKYRTEERAQASKERLSAVSEIDRVLAERRNDSIWEDSFSDESEGV